MEYTIGNVLKTLEIAGLEEISIRWLKRAEKTGCFHATISLAMIDYDRFRDEKKLFSLLELPENKKHPLVQSCLGSVYTGFKEIKKKKTGWAYLKAAADAGHAGAQFCVGDMYSSQYTICGLQAVESLSAAKLRELAIHYLDQSLALNNSAAQFNFVKTLVLKEQATAENLKDSYELLIKCGMDNYHILARRVLGLMIIKSFVARGLIKDQAIVTDNCNDIAAALIQNPIVKSYEEQYPNLKDLDTAKTFFPNTEWFKLPESEALHQFIDEQKRQMLTPVKAPTAAAAPVTKLDDDAPRIKELSSLTVSSAEKSFSAKFADLKQQELAFQKRREAFDNERKVAEDRDKKLTERSKKLDERSKEITAKENAFTAEKKSVTDQSNAVTALQKTLDQQLADNKIAAEKITVEQTKLATDLSEFKKREEALADRDRKLLIEEERCKKLKKEAEDKLAEANKLITENAQKKTELDTLDQNIKNQEASLAARQKTCSEQETENTKKKAELDALATEAQKKEADLSQAVSELAQRVQTTLDEAKRFEKQKSELEEKIRGVEKELAGTKQQLQTTLAEKDDVSKKSLVEIGRFQKINSESDGKIKRLEAEHTKLKEQLVKLEVLQERLAVEHGEQAAAINILLEDNEQYRASLAAWSAEALALRQTVSQWQLYFSRVQPVVIPAVATTTTASTTSSTVTTPFLLQPAAAAGQTFFVPLHQQPKMFTLVPPLQSAVAESNHSPNNGKFG